MKKWKKSLAGMRAPIPILCYIAALLLAVLTGIFNFGYDAYMKANEKQEQILLNADDFETVYMQKLEDNTYISTMHDPQMVLMNPATEVRRFSVEATYDRDTYERCLYYTTEEGAYFDAHKRAWPKFSADGLTSYYELPIGVKAIRLDPGSLTNLHMEFGEIILNPPRSFWSYFIPDGGGAFALVVLPALAASIIKCLIECKKYYFNKEGKQSE